MLDNIEKQKRRRRRSLASLPFDVKIAMLIHMQKIAREMAQSAGREFKGVVWCEESSPPSRVK
jgi:hypothetical protein